MEQNILDQRIRISKRITVIGASILILTKWAMSRGYVGSSQLEVALAFVGIITAILGVSSLLYYRLKTPKTGSASLALGLSQNGLWGQMRWPFRIAFIIILIMMTVVILGMLFLLLDTLFFNNTLI
jgi:hypothetical protein